MKFFKTVICVWEGSWWSAYMCGMVVCAPCVGPEVDMGVSRAFHVVLSLRPWTSPCAGVTETCLSFYIGLVSELRSSGFHISHSIH